MKKKPAISIIVPVYNAEKYLRECLESIRRQSFEDFEVVCVNDGSTDDSAEIIKEFMKQDERFVLVDQKNGGVNCARITGLKKASGEYIGWVDADDIIERDMYEKLYDLAQRTKSDTVFCNYNFYPSGVSRKKKWYRPFEGAVDWKFVSENTVEWNKLVKKSLLDKLKITRLFDEVGEGAYSFVLISSDKIATIDEALYNYRVGHESLSSNFRNVAWFKKVVDYAKRKAALMKEMGYSEYWQHFFYYIYLRYSLLLAVVASANGDKKTYEWAIDVVKKNGLFSGEYDEYLSDDFSSVKLLVFKNMLVRNYQIARLVSKVALR